MQTATFCNNVKIKSVSKVQTVQMVYISANNQQVNGTQQSSYPCQFLHRDIHCMQCIDTLSLCVLEAQSWMQTDPGISLCYVVLNTQHSVDSMLQMLISQQDVEETNHS